MENPKLIDVETLAKMWNVKKSWIYDRTYTGEIPHFKMGALIRFNIEECQKYLESKHRNGDSK